MIRHLRSYIRTLNDPSLYHGHGRTKNFFEGWFFKVIDRTGTHSYSFIPGIFLGSAPGKSHAFIQVMNGITGETFYHRFPAKEFSAERNTFNVRIGQSTFSATQLQIDVNSPDQSVRGSLSFSELKPWPVTFTSPGIMGWYSYVPYMECNHGVVSLDHAVHGKLTVNEQIIDFSGGRGYIEKDWGKSFPSAWIWIQSNHFGIDGTALTASVATIPWLFSSFRGFIIGLLHRGKLYRFATYTGAVLKGLRVEERFVHIEVQDKRYGLVINAERSTVGILHSPHDDDMRPRTAESLDAITEVELRDRGTGELIFGGTGRHSGLDINGNLAEIAEKMSARGAAAR